LALLPEFISRFPQINHHPFSTLYPVLKQALGIREVLTGPKSLWQNPYVEGLVGSIRRECLDHVIVLKEISLDRVLKSYFEYYERTRTHLSL